MHFSLLLAFISGIFTFLACSPYGHWAMMYVALVPLFFALTFPLQSLRHAFWTMMVFGLAFMGGMYGWMFSLGAWAPLWSVCAGWSVIVAFQAIFYAGIGVATYFSCVRWQVVAFFCFFIGSEWIRESLGPIGSSLGQLGYSQTAFLPMIQFASIAGVIGVSALLLLANYLIYRLICYCRYRTHFPVFLGIIGCILIVGCGIWGYLRLNTPISPAPTLTIGIVQGNHLQALKFSRTRRHQIWNDYFGLIAPLPSTDMMVLPETVTPGLNLNSPHTIGILRSLAENKSATIVFGTPIKSDGLYYNAVASVDSHGVNPTAYHKTQLMPFGEYWPFRGLISAVGLSHILSDTDYSRASSFASWTVNGIVTGPLICLESIYSTFARQHAEHGARLLISVANNGWFIGSRISETHLAMTQCRAIESGLPLIHVSNQGPSAVFSNRGEIIQYLPSHHSGAIIASLPLHSQATLFVSLGHYLGGLGLCVGVLLIIQRRFGL